MQRTTLAAPSEVTPVTSWTAGRTGGCGGELSLTPGSPLTKATCPSKGDMVSPLDSEAEFHRRAAPRTDGMLPHPADWTSETAVSSRVVSGGPLSRARRRLALAVSSRGLVCGEPRAGAPCLLSSHRDSGLLGRDLS